MPCLSDADFARPEELNAERQARWQVQRRRLLDSAFYQRHHPKAPVKIPHTIDEIRHSPFTDKSQLRNDQAQSPPFGSYLATSQDSVSRLHRTSGTTGHAMNLALSKNDAEMQAQVAGARNLRPAWVRAMWSCIA